MEQLQKSLTDNIKSPVFTAGLTAVALLGSYGVVNYSWGLLKGFNKYYLRTAYNHYQSYADGKGKSWCVVTGGSDGIGLEICHKMAQEGFNICIVGRNAEKIQTKLKHIEDWYKVQTKAVIFDFSFCSSIEDYRSKIAKPLEEIDVAMLFLNAGFGQCGAFNDLSFNDVQQMINVNVAHPAYTAKVIIDQLLARQKRSAIVITSSCGGIKVVPGMTTYCAAKSFASFLGEGLHYELKEKIDVMAWCPNVVETKMTGIKAGGAVLTTEKAVNDMLKHVGKEAITIGNAKHARQMWKVALIKGALVNTDMLPMLTRLHTVQIREGKAEEKK